MQSFIILLWVAALRLKRQLGWNYLPCKILFCLLNSIYYVIINPNHYQYVIRFLQVDLWRDQIQNLVDLTNIVNNSVFWAHIEKLKDEWRWEIVLNPQERKELYGFELSLKHLHPVTSLRYIFPVLSLHSCYILSLGRSSHHIYWSGKYLLRWFYQMLQMMMWWLWSETTQEHWDAPVHFDYSYSAPWMGLQDFPFSCHKAIDLLRLYPKPSMLICLRL